VNSGLAPATDETPTVRPPEQEPGAKNRWPGIAGSFLAVRILHALEQDERPWLVVTASNEATAQLARELDYLSQGRLRERLRSFPDREILPYDLFSPAPEIIAERLMTLSELRAGRIRLLLASASALGERLPPPTFLDQTTLLLKVGETLDLEGLRTRLEQAGYRTTGIVRERGDMALRGSILDLFAPTAIVPYRIELSDLAIDSLRSFDPETQLTLERLERIVLLPAREMLLNEESIRQFRLKFRAHFEGSPQSYGVYRSVSEGGPVEGLEAYLPLFYENPFHLLDYCHPTTRILWASGSRPALEEAQTRTETLHEQRKNALDLPPLPAGEAYASASELAGRLVPFEEIDCSSDPDREPPGKDTAEPIPPSFRIPRTEQDRLAQHLWSYLELTRLRGLIVAASPGRREALSRLFTKGPHPAPALAGHWDDFVMGREPWALLQAPIGEGFLWPEAGIAVLTENEIWTSPPVRNPESKTAQQWLARIEDFKTLSPGAPVIHETQGIGRYRGLVHLEVDGVAGEFLHLEYWGGDRLYVPIASLHLLSPYLGGDPDHAPWHRLGSGQWDKAKREARRRAHDVAVELLETHAQRQLAQAPVLESDPVAYERFSLEFPFEETPDQAQAIREVLSDLESPTPMDRVVCGDVGFGKTEVALRAAWVAVEAGYQVVVLVPTTLLAQQHLESFQDRFANGSTTVEMLSRFRNSREQAQIREKVASGEIGILIGTHKLLTARLDFRRLGLIVIDEEHRFGVRQKELLARFKRDVHTLTLTATPIPRTLNMALGGLRSLSIISTPPKDRLPVQTFLTEWRPAILQEALGRELQRGGQVYVVTPRIRGIEELAREISRWAPAGMVRSAHGQMPERELEQTMSDFYHHRFSVLVSTKIIESGIDIPTANTILIHEADRFGLAELHQLRGRVGRSAHRAYAYLCVLSLEALADDAEKRLETLTRFDALGSGLLLAMQDLEIRGAGELLGQAQSGEIEAVGFSLYTEYVREAVQSLKSGAPQPTFPPDFRRTEIDVHEPALIPERYVPDIHQRLVLYKRLASTGTPADLARLEDELGDRFGPLPEALAMLFTLSGFRLRATPLGIERIEASAAGGRVLFNPSSRIDPARLVTLMTGADNRYRMEGALRLVYRQPLPHSVDRTRWIDEILTILGG
jgi:transcription-repair coupling factor (superfamily II helicase)